MRISSVSGIDPAAFTERTQALTTRDWSKVYQSAFAETPAPNAGATPNRDFQHLWMRFVSSVAEFDRQKRVDALVRDASPPRLSAEAVRRAARDLAEVASARGAGDQWQVVDQVATFELGGAANADRHRKLADVAGSILEYLNAHPEATDSADGVDDWLVDAVEQWVAVAGVHDGQVEAMSQAKGAVLLEGPAGTGKTLAAHWLATSLGKELYRVDLSQVVSKYIGETEKNLARVFDEAERGGAVLLFDEADALFGKRTDVKDSHDRYANQEASLLLARIERYDGVAILATNASPKPDPEWLKRVATVVAIPLPPDPGPK